MKTKNTQKKIIIAIVILIAIITSTAAVTLYITKDQRATTQAREDLQHEAEEMYTERTSDYLVDVTDVMNKIFVASCDVETEVNKFLAQWDEAIQYDGDVDAILYAYASEQAVPMQNARKTKEAIDQMVDALNPPAGYDELQNTLEFFNAYYGDFLDYYLDPRDYTYDEYYKKMQDISNRIVEFHEKLRTMLKETEK